VIETLAAIDTPHFYAGIVVRGDKVIEAANIVRYMRGWSREKVRAYCERKGWKVSVVSVTSFGASPQNGVTNKAAQFAADVVPYIR
jgi:hypothetical protein